MNKNNLEAAQRLVNKPLRDFFRAEWANERDGGVSPATLSSAIDSLHQGGVGIFDMLEADDVIRLLVIRDLLPGRTRLDEITPDDGSND